MVEGFLPRAAAIGLALGLVISFAEEVRADLFINEIFFNVGGGGSDLNDEFIEIRGSADLAGASLANHYLLFLENELALDGTGNGGLVENIFDLSAFSLGSNGFLTLRQKGSQYTFASGTSDHVNTGGLGWGSGTTGALASTIGASGVNNAVQLEGGGFTAMLIRNDSGVAPATVPQLDLDSEVDNDGNPNTPNDGLDYPGMGRPGWTILDSVGIFAEPDETETGRLYGMANFGVTYAPEDGGFPEGWAPKVEPESEFQLLSFYEAEYIGRWGNSTGYGVADWHVSNFTDDAGSGSSGVPDWRQSCLDVSGSCHPGSDLDPNTPAPQPGPTESNQGVLYGTKLANTLGAPNFITGDFNKDGVVDAADYTVWRDSLGSAAGTETTHPAADANHDFMVDQADYDLWKANFGAPGNGSGAGSGGSAGASGAVPEPGSLIFAIVAMASAAVARRRRK